MTSSTDDALRQQPPRVLFVDDDDRMRSIFTKAITRLGYQIDTACSVGDAVAQAKARAYPVVVADLRVPDTNSRNLIEQIAQLRPDTTFVLITTDPAPAVQLNERVDGAIVSVLRKPIDL